jgi:4'-phosphopantetheinyl transferase
MTMQHRPADATVVACQPDPRLTDPSGLSQSIRSRLPEGMRLHFWSLDDDLDIALCHARALLSPDEVARAARFVQPRDRDRFIRGRGMVRQVLGEASGFAPATLRFAETGNGKPVLTGPGQALHFNLSHSEGCAVLAVSRVGPVGVDLELRTRRLEPLSLAPTVFSPDENRVLSALDASERRARFLMFWTAKEARMKLTGEGMSLEPRAIALALSGGWPTGYLRPEGPEVGLCFPDPMRPDAICALAWEAGACRC